MEASSPAQALRDARRRGPDDRRHHRLLLQRQLRLARAKSTRCSASSRSTAGTTSSTSRPACSAWPPPATPRAQYALGLGLVYLVVAIWGFIIGSGDSILGIVPVNTDDNVLHLILGLTGLAAGVAAPASARRAADARPPDALASPSGAPRRLEARRRRSRAADRFRTLSAVARRPSGAGAGACRPPRARRRRPCRRRRRPPGAPSCAGRGARRARSPRAPRPSSRARPRPAR